MFELQRESNSVPVVRLYRWVVPTVTYGRLQPRGAAEAFAAISGAKAVVQRPTGGGMVFHDSDLSFSVVWRRDHPTLPPCIKNVYRLFHEAIANELRSVGIAVSLHQTEGPKRTPSGACYQEFSQDDILLARNPQLSARTETKKAGFFTNKKVQVVAGTTDKLFCEGKRPDFFVESRDSTGDFGLGNKKIVGGALRVSSWGRLYQGNIKKVASMAPVDWELILVKAFERGVYLSLPATF